MDKGTALPIGNALRHIAMSRLPCWRPIAIGLNRNFNTIHASSNIVEDTFRIASSFSKFQYSLKTQTSATFLKEKFTFYSRFTKDDFKSEFFNVIGGENIPLITCLDSEKVELTIIYRFGVGSYSTMDNSQFILDNGDIPEHYFVMSSRHTEISKFSFDVVEDSTFSENLDILIESEVRQESVILQEAVNSLKEAINSLGTGEQIVT
jgi:DNA-directed RNA polymerase alpha subunit